MQIHSVPGNTYRLDGGAMFGNAAKAVWEHWMPADDQNRIRLATRAMLVITGKERILFEAGIGNYMEPRFRERYGVEEPGNMLLTSLAEKGISAEDITHIFISHLHFDHAGGLLSGWQEGKEPELLFPNAKFHVGEQAWDRATHPHPRDRASFIPHLHQKLEESRRLELVRKGEKYSFDDLDLQFFHSQGHSPGLLCADLRFGEGRLVYASDLIPGRFWVHLPISMGYDRFPELLIDEKATLLTGLADDHAWLFYVHDPDFAASRVQVDEARKSFMAIESCKELNIVPGEEQ
jgi:glyoxylase-like metal-dependent hydrolase (beta-lactamase superfamily II)